MVEPVYRDQNTLVSIVWPTPRPVKTDFVHGLAETIRGLAYSNIRQRETQHASAANGNDRGVSAVRAGITTGSASIADSTAFAAKLSASRSTVSGSAGGRIGDGEDASPHRQSPPQEQLAGQASSNWQHDDSQAVAPRSAEQHELEPIVRGRAQQHCPCSTSAAEQLQPPNEGVSRRLASPPQPQDAAGNCPNGTAKMANQINTRVVVLWNAAMEYKPTRSIAPIRSVCGSSTLYYRPNLKQNPNRNIAGNGFQHMTGDSGSVTASGTISPNLIFVNTNKSVLSEPHTWFNRARCDTQSKRLRQLPHVMR